MPPKKKVDATTRPTEDLADHRPDVYEEGGKWVFRASSFGSCDSALVRSALGHTPSDGPAFMDAGRQYGADNEHVAMRQFSISHGWKFLTPRALETRYGWGTVKANGQIELDLKVPGGVVRVHPDGVASCWKIEGATPEKMATLPYGMGDLRVVECKILVEGSRPFDNPNYLWQFSIEMAATGLKGIYVIAWKDRETKELNGKIDVAYYADPPMTLGQIKARAARLAKMIRQAEEGGGLPACDRKMFPCGFFADHDTETGIWAKEELPKWKLPDDALEAAGGWLALNADIDRLTAMRDEYKATILAAIKDLELTGSGDVAGFKVTRVQKKGSSRFDRKAAEKVLDLSPYISTGAPSEYVTIEPLP